MIQSFTFSSVDTSLRQAPGSIVQVRSTYSNNGLISCMNLLVLDKNCLELYLPASIGFTQARALEYFPIKSKNYEFAEGQIGVYHQIPALDLVTGEIVLIKEEDIIQEPGNNDLFTKREKEALIEYIVKFDSADLLKKMRDDWKLGTAMLVTLSN